MYQAVDEDGRDQMDEALEPPNAIDPTTGVPYGWDEGSELDGFMDLVGGG